MYRTKVIFSKKIIESDIENTFEQVLEKFPEFNDVCIFVKKLPFYGIQHTLRAYAPLLSLANPKRRRVYPIVININKSTPILFDQLSNAEKIGAIAHEFGHIYEYHNQNSLEIVRTSLAFLISKKFVKNFEIRADTIAIERGFGHELLSFREKIFNNNHEKLYGYRNSIYADPTEIQAIIDNKKIKITEKTQKVRALKYSLMHNIKTLYSFFPSIWQMVVLIYFKKIHKSGHI